MPKTDHNQLQFKPVFSFLVLEEIEETGITASGIIIPDRARMPLNQGRVIQKGPGCGDIRYADIEIGDIVVFTQHSEYKIQVDRESFLVVNLEHVMLVSKGKPQ